MNTMGISTDPGLLDVELPRTLVESSSVSTFLPDEEASICPLLSNSNGTSTTLAFSHPLNSCADNDSTASAHLCNDDGKGETSSSSGSSSGIGMDAPDNATTTLFNKLAYQHLQINNGSMQDANGHGVNGNLTLSKDTPSFVSWNWPLIRRCTFFVFMSSLLAMCAIVLAMIITLPKICNPKTAWYRGSVFYEIFPPSFQDSNNDGMGDIRGIGTRLDYLKSLGISAVRLNSIFPSQNYPEDFENITSLTEVATALGGLNDMQQLVDSLHARNISVILDLPVTPYVKELGKVNVEQLGTLITSKLLNNSASTTAALQVGDNLVIDAMRKWIELGIDGFYMKGLEVFIDDDNLVGNFVEWKRLLGKNRVLIMSETLLNDLEESKKLAILPHVDLVDVHLDVLQGTKHLEQRIQTVLSSGISPRDDGAWIHWSIGGVEKERITGRKGSAKITLAAILMQLMLPGTPSIFYGDEIALEGAFDPHNEHNDTKHLHHLPTMNWSNTSFQFTDRLPWLPQAAAFTLENLKLISNMVALRERSPSIYKNAICKPDATLPNTEISTSRNHHDIIVVERTYPRRNSFVSVSNFGNKHVRMDMTENYYSGIAMLQDNQSDKVYFGDFQIGPLQTIVVKLDK